MNDPFVRAFLIVWSIALPMAILAFIDWRGRRKQERKENEAS
jgi:hypothetical protein